MTELDVRVSSVLTEHGAAQRRHAYRDLSGQIAVAVCATHTTFIGELRPDDPAVEMCPLCAVFLMADGLDVDDWKNL